MDTQAINIERGVGVVSAAPPECVMGPELWSSAEEESEYERVAGDRLVLIPSIVIMLFYMPHIYFICIVYGICNIYGSTVCLQLRNSSVEVARGAYFFGARPVSFKGTGYRYDVGWSKDGRLTALNTLSPRRLIPAGGQIYELWDYLVRERVGGDLFSPADWLFLIDPAFPAQPLALELTADFRLWEGKGTDRTCIDDLVCLVPLRSMKQCHRNVRSNTQFLMVRSSVPQGFRSTHRLCFRALKTLGPGHLLHFDMGAFRQVYGWGDAAKATAVEIRRRFQGGEERIQLPDRIVDDRRQPWAYGFCPVGTRGLSPPRARGSKEDLSYLTSGLPWMSGAREEEAILSRRRGSGAPVATVAMVPSSSVSSVVGVVAPDDHGSVSAGDDEVGGSDGLSSVGGGTVRRRCGRKPGPIGAPPFTFATAYDPVTLELSARYARVPGDGFTWYDDADDTRSSAARRDWFAAYVAERRARNLVVTRGMTMRLKRYEKNASRYAAKRIRKGGGPSGDVVGGGAAEADGGPVAVQEAGSGLDGGSGVRASAQTESAVTVLDVGAPALEGCGNVASSAGADMEGPLADGASCVSASSAAVAEVQSALQRVGGRPSAEQAAAMLDLLRGLEP